MGELYAQFTIVHKLIIYTLVYFALFGIVKVIELIASRELLTKESLMIPTLIYLLNMGNLIIKHF